jgi:formate/nitrite transporter
VGFILLVLLGLELFTGNAAMLPYAVFGGRVTLPAIIRPLVVVYLGNLVGCLLYALLFAAADTKVFTTAADPVGLKLVAVATAKVLPYKAAGLAGWVDALLKGILCNWMVSMGAVMAMVSRSVIGKIVAMWMPIMAFVAQGFEHCVVNMFVIPGGMMLGAPISIGDWLVWNELPVTIGNLIGAVVLTAFGLWAAFRGQAPAKPDVLHAAAE